MTPLRSCTEPGCPELVRSGRCERHRKKDPRPSARRRGYDAAHEAWREKIFARDKVCRKCGAPGKPSDHADHIIPIRDGGERLSLENGQRLCSYCHNSVKQSEERGGGRDIEADDSGPAPASDFLLYGMGN